VPLYCHLPNCINCWRHRVSRARDSIRAQVMGWSEHKTKWLMTRSIRNHYNLKEAYREYGLARERWRDAARRKVSHSWNRVTDWVGVDEITNTGKGWNLHEHSILLTEVERLKYADWRRDWNLAVGSPSHMDLQRLRYGSDAAVKYVTKYITKRNCLWGGLTVDQATSNMSVLRRRRFLRRKRGSAPKLPPSTTSWEKCCLPDSPFSCVLEDLFRSP